MLRLNLAIPPASEPQPLGLVGGDAAGYPNGRRVDDDVVTIELRAVAGVTIPLVDPSFTPDGAAGPWSRTGRPTPTVRPTRSFPYLANPGGGYQTQPGTTSVVTRWTRAPENAFAGQGAVLLDIGGRRRAPSS